MFVPRRPAALPAFAHAGLPALTLAGVLLVLAGCAGRQAPVATYPTRTERSEAAQAPPAAAFPDAGDARDVWRLRSALNVAALGCRRAGDRTMAIHYNALLKKHATLLTRAYLAEEDRYRKAHGADWQAVQGRDATRLYNLYANQDDPARYCREAIAIGTEALRTSEADFPRFAAAALPRLEPRRNAR